MSSLSTIAQAFVHDSVWMIAILGVQIASLAIIFERVMALYFVRGPKQKDLARHIETDIRKGDYQKVIGEVRRFGDQPISAVAAAGAQAALNLGGKEEIQARMDEILLVENSRFEKRIGFLAMLGNVSTLLGLLGTIVGMIQAFNSITGLDPVRKSEMLTKGVALAMSTTAYGLIAAIPALVMYAVLQNRANILSEDLNQAALRLFNLMSFSNESLPRSTAKRSRAFGRRADG